VDDDKVPAEPVTRVMAVSADQSAGSPGEATGSCSAAVLSWLDAFVDELPVPGSQRRLLALVLEGGRRQLSELPELPAAALPVLVHAAAGGLEGAALPLGGACTLVYLGADLLDILADGELTEPWCHLDPGQTTLVSATMLSALPLLALARLEVPGRTSAGLTSLFGDGLLKMSVGQHLDLESGGARETSPREARAVAEAKSGAEFALFTQCGAVLAGVDAQQSTAYAELGHAVGVAAQILSDMGDLSGPSPSQDLLNGKRTLPVAHGLASRAPDRRSRLLELLDRAQRSPDAHDEVRRALSRSGSFAYTALVTCYYRERALRRLEQAKPLEPGARDLRALLNELASLASVNALPPAAVSARP